ncbi:MAG: phosphatidate cytidylyltransferase [Alphaproteobacteria bacterium]|nr:phosphatidate cytidylyltransferase [Alphaproteobacteria bacterium]
MKTERSSELKKRVLSALVMIPLVLLSIFLGFPYFNIAVALLSIMMCLEWDAMLNDGKNTYFSCYASIIAVFSALHTSLPFMPMLLILIMACSLLILFFALRVHKIKNPVVYTIGVLMILTFVACCIYLQNYAGVKVLFWLLGIVWFTDTGAYIAGKSIGGLKFIPKISPNKTWAGFFGGLVFSILWSGCFINFYPANAAIHPSFCSKFMLMSVAVSVIAQLGDMFESAAKRHINVKDSGDLIPGHGGVLDRLDSLVLAAPFVAFIYYLSDNKLTLWW